MDAIKLRLGLSKEYRIVLEGGSTRGAYQAGAWRTPREASIRIRGAAGTSVGALNNALICMDDLEKTEHIWENISYFRVMDVDDELMRCLRRFSLKDTFSLASFNVEEFITRATRVLKDSSFNIAPPGALIEDVVDEGRIRNLDRELCVVTYSISDRHPLIANIKEAPEGAVADLLMANAYLASFHQERLGGKYYMDGGGVNNVPMDVLLNRRCRDVIIMRIYGYGVDTEKKLEIPGGINPYHVALRRNLDDLPEFDKRRARRDMLLGYFNGKRTLYGLAGRVYYIDASEDEPYYFDKMMSEIQSLLSYVKPELETTGETRAGREIRRETTAEYHVYTGQVFPRLAKELRLKEGWDHKKLYLSILEDLARQYRISRFKIYTVEEFPRLIHRKAGTATLKAMAPVLDNGTQVQHIMHKDAWI